MADSFRPIIFSAPMIRRLIAGKKTQTRRVVNEATLRVRLPHPVRGDGPWAHLEVAPGVYRAKLNDGGAVTICSAGRVFDLGVKPGEFHFICPYVDGETHLGDYGNGRKRWTITTRDSRLWVREGVRLAGRGVAGRDVAAYVADDVESPFLDHWPWKVGQLSPIFLPYGMRRLELGNPSVRLERLTEIDVADAIAEGAVRFPNIPCHHGRGTGDRPYGPCTVGGPPACSAPRWSMEDPIDTGQTLGSPQMAFANFYNKVHGGPRWNCKPDHAPFDLNPWVWVLGFTVHNRMEA